MEAAKEPIKDPASSRPTAGRGNSRKRFRPGGLRSRNKAAKPTAQHALRIVALGGARVYLPSSKASSCTRFVRTARLPSSTFPR